MTRLDRPFPQIATGDFDIAVVGQLPAANLPLSDEFEPSPVKVVGFEAAFRRRGLGKQDLENGQSDWRRHWNGSQGETRDGGYSILKRAGLGRRSLQGRRLWVESGHSRGGKFSA
jgi:hypothetical protein